MISKTGDLRNLLRQHFPNISEPQLQDEIIAHAKLMSFEEGELIMDYGSYIRMVPLVIEGSIKVMREGERGNELFLYYLKANEICSMSFTCCMMYKQSVIKAVCEEESTIISIPIQYVDDWIVRFKSWKNFVMSSYDERMYQLVEVIDSIAFSKMDERLLDYLQKRSEAVQSKQIHATHQAIADDLNASREAISRLLKRLEKLGVVALGRNSISLLE